MSLIGKYVDGRVVKVLNEMNLNVDSGTSIMFDKDFDMAQNKMQYFGNTEELIKFYKTRRPKNMLYSTNVFYRVVNNETPILHFPLANIITKTMVNLLFSDNPLIEANSGNKSKDKKLNELIRDIYKDNNFGDLLQRSCEMESYSGAVAIKVVLDPEFSDYPILVPYPKEDIEIVKKYDRITEIIFKDTYDKGKDKYILYTIAGRGYTDYKLYKDNKNKDNIKEVPLNTIEETAGLHRLDFFNRDGTPYRGLMALYKENKAGAVSDYHNLIDDFAALDEVYSNLIDFVRKSKIKTYMPESLLDQDLQTGKKYVKSEYDSSVVILHDSNPAGTPMEAKRDIVDVNNSIMGYKEAFNNILLNALSTAGLSPCSVGLDMSGANSSALALNIRERVSLRTRAEKQKRWNEALQELTKLLLNLYSVTVNESEEGTNVYLDAYDKDINITFPEYESPTFSEQVSVLSEALNNNLIDLESALQMLYPEKSEEDIEIMRMQIEGQLPDGETIEEKELDSEDESDEENDKKEEN